ncbi:peptidase m20 [Stylonychia lemnae]|uniref:Peptidase m20 n=1 Tax=Stylonychia lemnae TaxID=5949 RepID=A0A078AQS9_STYLE|nr:peptidase m20 [Stylonychia lemnae]|eukprot:CDW84286.1 peptidase m20 [Stylonychia lemnae]
MILYRQHFHKFPEGHLKEYKTQAKIREILLSIGCQNEWINDCAGTGLVVNLRGQGEPDEDKQRIIALRADIDGLKMQENNDLEYKSQTEYAHMCGHDGHISMLLAAASIFIQNLNKISQNMMIRLLFQPAEEGPGGALPMINDGCLEGVDEIFGLHNRPIYLPGLIRVKSGAVMASSTIVEIKVRGVSGHGSQPHMIQDAISASAAILCQLHAIKSRLIESKHNVVLSITQFTGGFADSVFPDSCYLQGTIRTFDSQILKDLEDKIIKVAQTTAISMGCTAEVKFVERYPPLINHPDQAKFIENLTANAFGAEFVGEQGLPVSGAEDFSFYLHHKPGCFFFLLTYDFNFPNRALHQSNFDFNDNLLATGAYIWVKIIEEKFNCKLLTE